MPSPRLKNSPPTNSLPYGTFRHFAQHVKGKRVVPIVNQIGSVFSSLMVAGPNQLSIGYLHIFIRNQRKGLFPRCAMARFVRGFDPYNVLAVYKV